VAASVVVAAEIPLLIMGLCVAAHEQIEYNQRLNKAGAGLRPGSGGAVSAPRTGNIRRWADAHFFFGRNVAVLLFFALAKRYAAFGASTFLFVPEI
jgi:hypothetical protein